MEDEDLAEFKTNLSQMDSQKLCEVIVSNRYLGIMREQAILSMEELAKRRTNGEIFDYENTIENLYQTLPKINLDLNKILKKVKIY